MLLLPSPLPRKRKSKNRWKYYFPCQNQLSLSTEGTVLNILEIIREKGNSESTKAIETSSFKK